MKKLLLIAVTLGTAFFASAAVSDHGSSYSRGYNNYPNVYNSYPNQGNGGYNNQGYGYGTPQRGRATITIGIGRNDSYGRGRGWGNDRNMRREMKEMRMWKKMSNRH